MATDGKASEVIRAFVRIRPPIASEIHHENCLQVPSIHDLHLHSEKYDIKCQYDHVFNELTTQEEIFQQISPLLDDLLKGYNASIFAYGQTSAGKTHTMLGPNGGQDLNIDRSHWGVIPRASEYLFNHLQERSEAGGFKYIAKASFLQIYNEKLYDLLRSTTDDTELRIREIPHPNNKTSHRRSSSTSTHKASSSGSHKRAGDHGSHAGNHPCEVFITGLSEFRIQTTEDILRVIRVGTHSRATRSTNSNLTSSRSHAILQLTFEMEDSLEYGQKMIYKSKLSLIDLAGSEKMVALGNISLLPSSEHLKELTAINQSLSSLGNVISALASKHRPHIPYRDSKLTRILQDSLGGNTRTILLSCVTPSLVHATETISTLQFTDRAKNVMIKSRANLVIDDKALLSNAQAEISRLKLLLKQALLRIETLTRGAGAGAGAGEGIADYFEQKPKGSGGSGVGGGVVPGGGGAGRVGLQLDDGETREEMERVLRENKEIRRENQLLLKELRGVREAEEMRRKRARDRDRERDRGGGAVGGGGGGGKREWSLRDDRYRVSRSEEHRTKKKPGAPHAALSVAAGGGLRGKESRARGNGSGSRSGRREKRSQSSPDPSSHSSYSNDSQSNGNGKDSSSPLPLPLLPSIASASGPSPSAASASVAPETSSSYSLPSHRQFKIREALGLDQQPQQRASPALAPAPPSAAPVPASVSSAIGSPTKASLDRIRKEYFLRSSDETAAITPAQEREGEEQEQEDEFDVKKLREKVQRARDSEQLKEVERSLNHATRNVVRELEIDERSLSDIQRSRQELERQLQQLSKAQEEAEDEEEEEEQQVQRQKEGEEQQRQQQRPSPLPSPHPSLSSSSPLSSSSFLSRQSSLSRLRTREELLQQTSTPTAASTSATAVSGVAVCPPPQSMLKHDRSDVGKRLELYIYRYNCWEEIEVADYEPTKGLHKVRHLDRTEQWLDLKKKQLRLTSSPNDSNISS